MAQPARPPVDRYGAAPRRPRWVSLAAVGALATAFLAWVVWAALAASDTGPSAEVTAFRVRSADVLEVQVGRSSGTDGPLVCTVRALDRTRGVVGVAEVTVDPADDAGGWVEVRTRDRAVTATVGSCVEAPTT